MSLITTELIQQVSGISLPHDLNVDELGLIDDTCAENLLSFIDTPKFISLACTNKNISAVFTTQIIAEKLKEINSKIVPLIVNDPRWCFYTLHNEIALIKEKTQAPSVIHPTAIIAPEAYVDKYGVFIGAKTVVEPGGIILKKTAIGNGCVIRAGAIIGTAGFEHKRTSQGILSVVHDGAIEIGNDVEIGGGSHIARSFGSRNTVIGDETKLDALVHVAHGVSIGSRCLLAAHAVICGSVTIGDDVWIGPSVTISNGIQIENSAFVTIGSCVIKNVRKGERVTGYFALPHEKFLIRSAK